MNANTLNAYTTCIRDAALRGCHRGDDGYVIGLLRLDIEADELVAEAVEELGMNEAARIYRAAREAFILAHGAPRR
jgi:hypothetical protein